MCGNTVKERLEHLRPVVEDWHCLVAMIGVCNPKKLNVQNMLNT